MARAVVLTVGAMTRVLTNPGDIDSMDDYTAVQFAIRQAALHPDIDLPLDAYGFADTSLLSVQEV